MARQVEAAAASTTATANGVMPPTKAAAREPAAAAVPTVASAAHAAANKDSTQSSSHASSSSSAGGRLPRSKKPDTMARTLAMLQAQDTDSSGKSKDEGVGDSVGSLADYLPRNPDGTAHAPLSEKEIAYDSRHHLYLGEWE